MTVKYGKKFPDGIDDLEIELWCYAHDDRKEGERGRLTRFEHFKNAVDICWNYSGSTRRVIWNDWTDTMIKEMIANRYTGLAGSGSSGKSDAAALFCLVECLSDPTQTLCLVFSTTLGGARKRIWKSVSELWNSLEAKWKQDGKVLPFKMVDSKGMLVGMDMNGKWSEGIGITLIAADKENEAEAAKKLKGLKAPAEGAGRLRAVADEFSDLGESVLVAMLGNLNTNADFKGIGMSNPGSRLTPFGKFVMPEGGWATLTPEMTRWKTQYGVCVRFDALDSPRMRTPELEKENGMHSLYGWMPSKQAIDQMAKAFGEDSVEYWAQVRGMFCPTGMERTVWSENELIFSMAPQEVNWDLGCKITKIAALDPSFTDGGDRSVMIRGECGTIGGKKVLNVIAPEILAEVASDDSDRRTPSERLIDQFRDKCNEHGILPRNAAFDSTGSGVTFAQWMHTKWSPSVIGVNSAESPVDRRADSINGPMVFKNRVSQLWIQPKAYVRNGQIMNIPADVAEELCQRRYNQRNEETSKAWVESKKDMKARMGRSPDLGDAFCILVEIAVANGLLDNIEIKSVDRKICEIWKSASSGRSGKPLFIAPKVKKLKIRK